MFQWCIAAYICMSLHNIHRFMYIHKFIFSYSHQIFTNKKQGKKKSNICGILAQKKKKKWRVEWFNPWLNTQTCILHISLGRDYFLRYMRIAWIYQHIVAVQVQLSQFTNCNIWCHIALSVNAVICGI